MTMLTNQHLQTSRIAMKKRNISLSQFTSKLSDIPIPKGVRRWRQGAIAGGTLASGVAVTALALVYWQRHKRSKSYSYATSTFDTLEVGAGVQIQINFATVSHASLRVSYPNALRRRVKVRMSNKTLSISRLPYRNRWVQGDVFAELTLPSISQLRVVGDAKVAATGCNKLETPFDLLQIGGQVEGLTIDAHYAEVQLRGNAKADLYLSCDQSFIGYSGSPEIRTVLQSEGHTHITATGSGRATLLGQTKELSLTASDRSVVEADSLTVEGADALLSDSAECHLHVTDRLSYTLCNDSKLGLTQQPKRIVKAEVLDSATLETLDGKR